MSYKLYLELIKEDMENMIKSGQVPLDQIIEITMEKLAVLGLPDFNKIIENYRIQKKELLKQVDTVNKQVVDLVEKYYKELKEM